MWFFTTKGELKHEIDKIKTSFRQVKADFAERDHKIKQLGAKIETNALKIATLEGSYLALSQKSQSQVSSKSQSNLKQSQVVSGKSRGKFETNLIRRIKQNKKALVIAEITKLLNSHSIIDIFERIVIEKGLCSKASFYRYVSSLKSQGLIETETKTDLRLKAK